MIKILKFTINSIKGLITGSIRMKLASCVFFFIIFPVIFLVVYSAVYIQSILVQKASESSMEILSSISSTLKNITDNMITTAKFVSFDSNVVSILDKSREMSYISVDDSYSVEKMLLNLQVNYLNHYFQIDILANSGESISTLESVSISNYVNQPWYKDVTNNKGKNIWIAPYNEAPGPADPGSEQIMVATSILNYNTNKQVGIVTVRMRQDNFRKMLFYGKQKHQDSSEIVLVANMEGEIISSTNADYSLKSLSDIGLSMKELSSLGNFGIRTIDSTKYLINQLKTETPDWLIIQMIPYNNLMSQTYQLYDRIKLISIFILAALVFILFAFSKSLTSPIRNLVRHMNMVEKGDMSVKIISKPNRSKDEITVLENAFNHMIDNQRELIERIKVEEHKLLDMQRKESELKLEMLAAQINPHFLFNTLNVIKWSASMSGLNNVSMMISHLGNLLETSLNKNNDTVLLDDEIKNVNSYLFIQKVRFDNKFTVEFFIPESVKRCIVPKLILQPLVENSIIHGFNTRRPGLITISALRDRDMLYIYVCDNGKGIDELVLQKFNGSAKQNNYKHRFSGIGINNVNDRIRLLYGSEYGLSIRSIKNKGTLVTISLPYKEAEENNVQSIGG